MLKLLLKKQLTEIFRSYFYDAKKNRARSKAGTAAYIALFVLLMVGVLGGLFTMLSLSLCNTMHAAALDWLYFAILGLLAIFLGAFGSVFNTYAGLYLAKDNDLLLSMPIPVSVLMASRLLGVYLMGLMYSGVVLLPAVIVYWIVAAPSAAAVVGLILLVLLVSIFVLTLSCALGWVVAKISVKLKNKSFLTVLAALVFFGLYYFVYFKAQAVIGDLQQNAAIYGAQIKGSVYPVYLFGSVGAGDGIAMLIVTVVVLGLFILLWRLLARSFLQIATATGGTAKRVYRQREAKRRSISAALLQKELGRFTASPSYMLNCGLGILMLVAGGIVLLFKGQASGLAFGCASVWHARCADVGAVYAPVLPGVHESDGGAVGLAGGEEHLDAPVPAGDTVAGTVGQALFAAADDGASSAVLYHLCHDRMPDDGAGAAAACGGAAVVCSDDGAGEPHTGTEDAKPTLDQRDHAHQAERRRSAGDADRLCL